MGLFDASGQLNLYLLVLRVGLPPSPETPWDGVPWELHF